MSVSRTIYADVIFFTAAALFAIIAAPLWVAMLAGWTRVPGPYWHGHEMLFGYVLLVLAGYLIVRAAPATLALLLALWLAARAAPFIWPPHSMFSVIPDLAFAFAVAAMTARPFLRAAKKAQNRVFGPLLLAFFFCDAAYQAGALRDDPALQATALSTAVDLYSLLVLLMGGRVIPAVVAGYLHRKGRSLEARVQPPLEKAAIGAMIGMIVCDLFVTTRPLAGVFAMAAALVTAIRFARWRPRDVLGQPQLWAIGLGYAWLVPGLALKGWTTLSGSTAFADALHALTLGAIGTLTLVMMARKRLQREPGGLTAFGDIGFAALILTAATLVRLTAPVTGANGWMVVMAVSALCWMLAFALLLRRLLRTAGEPG